MSTSHVWRRFKGLNKDKEWCEQIKPFNFFLVGFQAVEDGKKAVKPLSPFSKDPQTIVYQPFIDSETGDIKQGIHYWKSLSRTILDYMEHPEYKFEGDIGFLERRHIVADGVVYIGKEANDIDDPALGLKRPPVFWNGGGKRDSEDVAERRRGVGD